MTTSTTPDDERCPTCDRRLRHSWQPFQPGHETRLEHGARAPRHVDPIAAELASALLEDRPELGNYPEAVMAWARAEARCILFADWHARCGFLDEDTGEMRGGSKVGQFEAQAANLRTRLGLDPASDATLRKAQAEAITLTADLVAIRERGRAALEQRRAQLAALPGTDPTPLPAPADHAEGQR
jgi:hypothetical protein